MSEPYSADFEIFPFDNRGMVSSFNLLRCTQTSHPEFTPTDSLVDVRLTNEEASVTALSPREKSWRLPGETSLTVNLETGVASLEGTLPAMTLKFHVTRQDLNRQEA